MHKGKCEGCGAEAFVNLSEGRTAIRMVRAEVPPGHYCADCFEKYELDKPAGGRTASSSGPNHNNPGFDNVIRAMEEDR